MTVKKIFAALLALLAASVLVFSGCDTDDSVNADDTETTTEETSATKPVDEKLIKEISDCVALIAKADKTNALEDELKKYPMYYIESENGYEGMEEFKYCIENYFYTCDTQYKVLSVEDVTREQKKSVETDLKENYDADIDIQKVVLADIDYKYTNYNTDNYIDDLDFHTESQYFIKFEDTWYYGWGLDLNMEVEEIEA